MRTAASPLSRPTAVNRLPPDGAEVTVEADARERAALAADLDLPAIHALRAVFRLRPLHGRVAVSGSVRASVEQVCVVTLDPFAAEVDEPVEVIFAESEEGAPQAGEAEHAVDLDAPDPIHDGRIDLGVLTAEFLALGLDPYPRKPGARFEDPDGEVAASPFAKLSSLRGAGH